MTNKKSNESRRKLLKSIAAGSGAVIAGKSLPEKWSRPVVDSVLLPSHALTSLEQYTNIPANAALENDSLLANAMDSLIPEAEAQPRPQPHYADRTCLTLNPDHSVKIEGLIIDGYASSQVRAPIVWIGGDPVEVTESKCMEITNGVFSKVSVRVTDISNGVARGYYLIGSIRPYRLNFYLPMNPCSAPACSPPMISDRAVKSNFAPVDEQEILRKVASMPIETWNYTDREPGVRHIGPMAQDFMASFSVGDSDRHIHMVDANGVNLAAIKALNSKLEEKDAQIKDLQEQLGKVIGRLDKLV